MKLRGSKLEGGILIHIFAAFFIFPSEIPR